jgi:hypothetical protein
MARAKQKNTTAFATTADAKLFKLHDTFVKAYATMQQYKGGAGAGSLPTGTKEERALYRKWQRALDDATQKARAVVDAPAVTLEGMLMKIHVAGFTLSHTKPGTFSVPYHGMLCKNGPQSWEPGKFSEEDEIALIVSLRDDLHRFSGRRA